MDSETADQRSLHPDASMLTPSQLWLLGGMSTLAAGIGTWLLYDEMPGINWTLWTLAASLGFIFWARTRTRALGAERATLLALACLLGAAAAMTGMFVLEALIALCIMLLAALVLLASQRPLPTQSPLKMAIAPLAAVVAIVVECSQRASEVATLMHAERSIAAVRGTLIATPILIAFFLLLSPADPTLAHWRDSAFGALSSVASLQPVFFFIVLGVATFGAYGIAARQALRPDATGLPDAAVSDAAEPRASGLADTERLIVLGSLALLFALFLVLQLSYLFGNSGSREGSGLTFAAAAHRGFAELTVTAAASALLIIALDRFARRGAREHLVKYCALLLMAESLPMLLSANARITHYEAAYGYTLLRLYVHVYIAIVCVAMLLLARQALRCIEPVRLLRQLAMTATITLAILAFWNHAAWIVDKNVARYVATGTIDVMYLTRLADAGSDALPQLVASLPRLAPVDAEILRVHLEKHRAALLHERELRWYQWHLRRTQAYDALQRLPSG